MAQSIQIRLKTNKSITQNRAPSQQTNTSASYIQPQITTETSQVGSLKASLQFIHSMITFQEISDDGEQWELFARDFLSRLGFYIESAPDRGPDGGKDMLVSEQVQGTIHQYRFSWLVSCKHFAQSGKAISENDHEKNILERVRGFKADGFIGFYSTLPSSGLNFRLRQLRDGGDIKDYKFFDGREIENYLVTGGFSDLMIRYLPKSYKIVKPIHLVTGKYEPLRCDSCGKDLLLETFNNGYTGLIANAFKYSNGINHIKEVYFACKGDCDRKLRNAAQARDLMTNWQDISDILIPIEHLRNLFAIMNRIRDNVDTYSPEAFDKLKQAYVILAQRTHRYTTKEERKRFSDLLSMQF